MAGGEGRHLVEEEQLGELAGRGEAPVPVAKLELTGDPTLAVEAQPDAAMLVVEATAVAVNEATRRNGDELAERCDTVLAQKRFLLEAVTLGAQPSPRRRAFCSPSSSSDRVLWIEGAEGWTIRGRSLLARARRPAAAHASTLVVVEQAKGVLSERIGLEMDGAFGLLRYAARGAQLKIHDLAQSVVDSSETPEEVVRALAPHAPVLTRGPH